MSRSASVAARMLMFIAGSQDVFGEEAAERVSIP
jgi:hypothetical protein